MAAVARDHSAFKDVPRPEAESTLLSRGDGFFIFRPSSIEGKLVISYSDSGRIHHLLINIHPFVGAAGVDEAGSEVYNLHHTACKTLGIDEAQPLSSLDEIVRKIVEIVGRELEPLSAYIEIPDLPAPDPVAAPDLPSPVFGQILSQIAAPAVPSAELDGKAPDLEKMLGRAGRASFVAMLEKQDFSELELRYKGIIEALLMLGDISEEFRDKIAKWKTRHALSGDQHEKVVKSLGLSESDLKSVSVPDDSLCVVCLTQARNCAFPACGHVGTCFPCGKLLNKCPLCRTPIEADRKPFKVFL